MLDREKTALLVVDVQERLFPHIHGHEALADSLSRMVRGAAALALPVVVTEQYVKGLGPTLGLLREEIEPFDPVEKMCFSCLGEPSLLDRIGKTGAKEILLSGIEAHVCVYQTACDLLERGYGVHLLADCVGSRSPRNLELAVRRMEKLGASLTSMEMALFELMRVAGTPEFRKISKIVK